MKNTIALSDDVSDRLDQLAERSTLTREQIVEEALTKGRTLAWQEKWIAGVREGLADAETENFAGEAEISAVLNKFNA
jgi:predicted transcriptional regulator